MAHKDVEYVVDDENGQQHIFSVFDQAAGFAVTLALCDGKEHNLDVLVWSAKGAAELGGDDAVDTYREDPDASVFERFVVTVKSLGRVA
jgi:hypothetical protein